MDVWGLVLKNLVLGSPSAYPCLESLPEIKRVCKTLNTVGSAQQLWYTLATTVYRGVKPVVPVGTRFVEGVQVPSKPVSLVSLAPAESSPTRTRLRKKKRKKKL